MKAISYTPIGIIRSPFNAVEGMPIQSKGAEGIRGTVELNPELVAGLQDLDGFSHIILLYSFHLSNGYSLVVKPFLDDRHRGVFSTRAPKRPNSIGISIVKLVGISGNILHIEDVDIVDGTPLLDIKPFVPEFDMRRADKIGWFADKSRDVKDTRADERFK